jgi:hypothetical protein
METGMTNKARNTAGKFSAKSETPRKVRSVNLTENCWQWLARIAEEAGMSRNDYLEALAEATANPPIMETAEATAANPIMETVQAEIENTEKQPDINLLPIMEAVETGIKLHKQLEASDAIIRTRNREIAALNARIIGKDEIIAEAQEQIARLESEIASRPEQNLAPIAIGAELPEIEAADLLNQLKGARKKSKADLADIEAVLEILDK